MHAVKNIILGGTAAVVYPVTKNVLGGTATVHIVNNIFLGGTAVVVYPVAKNKLGAQGRIQYLGALLLCMQASI